MAIQTSCPNCEAAYTLADTQRGKKVRCRKCSETFVVGGDKDKSAPVGSSTKSRTNLRRDGLQDSPRPAGRSTPPPKSKPAPRRDRDRDDEDDDEDDRPSLKKKRGSSTPMILMIVGGIVLVLLLCGGGGVFVAYWWVSSTVTNGVDNLQQQIANGNPNDPFAPPDPNNPFGNVPFADLAQPKDVGEALDWVKNGATADKQNKGADWLSRAAVDNNRQKEVAAALETLVANPNTKDAAVRSLSVWAGPEDAATLLGEVDAKFDVANGAAGDALVRLQYAPAAAVIAKRLPDFFHHGDAARLLAKLGAPLAEKEVLKYMNSTNNDARNEASGLLRTFGTKPEAMFDQSVADLKNTDAAVAKNACDYIAKTPVNAARRAEVANALDAALADGTNGGTRDAAAVALKTWGTKDNVVGLIALLDSEPPFHPHLPAAADALAMLKDERGAEALARYLTDAFHHDDAVRALRAIGPVAQKAVAGYVNNTDQRVRNDAEKLLKGYGAKGDVKLDVMAADLDATDTNQRKNAAEYLATVPADDAHQKAIARSLDRLLDDPDPFGQVRKAAAKAEVVWGDKDSVPALVAAMQKENSDIWQPCMEALGRIKDERSVGPLLLQTGPKMPHIREAQKALVQMGPVVETAMDNGLADPATNADDKRAICLLLGKEIGTKVSIPALTTAMTSDPDAKVKASAAAALKLVKARNP